MASTAFKRAKSGYYRAEFKGESGWFKSFLYITDSLNTARQKLIVARADDIDSYRLFPDEQEKERV